MKKKLLALTCIIVIVASCKKDKNEEIAPTPVPNTPSQITDAGFGPSTLPFTAAKWQLPAGVQLQDSIHEYSYCWAFSPYTQIPPKDWKGVPLGFSFCLTLINTSAHPVTIPFPPQLVFACSSTLYQNVVCIDLGIIELPAQATQTFVSQGFCLNAGRHGPQPYDAAGNFLSYSFGPATLPDALQEIVDIVRSKHITMNDILNSAGAIDNDKTAKYIVIQQAIWEVTDMGGLTTATKNKLLAL